MSYDRFKSLANRGRFSQARESIWAFGVGFRT
jgi:hypothetical protein